MNRRELARKVRATMEGRDSAVVEVVVGPGAKPFPLPEALLKDEGGRLEGPRGDGLGRPRSRARPIVCLAERRGFESRQTLRRNPVPSRISSFRAGLRPGTLAPFRSTRRPDSPTTNCAINDLPVAMAGRERRFAERSQRPLACVASRAHPTGSRLKPRPVYGAEC
jgi:hypothetical protein